MAYPANVPLIIDMNSKGLMMTTRESCLALDRKDPLARLRDEFVLPENTIYLDGNSLGALPKASVARSYQTVVGEWGESLIASWNQAGWWELPHTIGNRLAPLIGAGQDEVVVADSISVNLFKWLVAALRHVAKDHPERTVIVSERGNFPSDLYIAEGVIDLLGPHYSLRLIDSPAELDAALDDRVAVAMLTQVDYRTGYLHDMAKITQLVQGRGALMLWDLAHSAGAVPIDLTASGADGAVGCTYKYLNSGPCAPGFLWLPKRYQGVFKQPLTGWRGHREPFKMDPHYQPDTGVGHFLCSEPPIVALSLVDSALSVFEKTDMQALRTKSLALTELFIELVDARCAGLGVGLASPRDPAQRGSQVSLTHENAYAVMQALIHRRIIGDFREPNILRFGFTPLYVRFVDVWDTVDALLSILQSETWRDPVFNKRHAVT